MTIATTDVYIRPEDGWTLIATNPQTLVIKPEDFHPWWLAVTNGGAPAVNLIGLSMGRGNDARRESFQAGPLVGEVYIRVRDPIASQPVDQAARFGVIVDQV